MVNIDPSHQKVVGEFKKYMEQNVINTHTFAPDHTIEHFDWNNGVATFGVKNHNTGEYEEYQFDAERKTLL